MEVALLIWLLFAIIGGMIYSSKGHGFGWGCVLGFLLGPIGCIIALCIPRKE